MNIFIRTLKKYLIVKICNNHRLIKYCKSFYKAIASKEIFYNKFFFVLKVKERIKGIRDNTTEEIWMQTIKMDFLRQDNWTQEAINKLKVSNLSGLKRFIMAEVIGKAFVD